MTLVLPTKSWDCTGWGLPPRRVTTVRRRLLPYDFTLTVHTFEVCAERYVSVALSLGLLPAGVTCHP